MGGEICVWQEDYVYDYIICFWFVFCVCNFVFEEFLGYIDMKFGIIFGQFVSIYCFVVLDCFQGCNVEFDDFVLWFVVDVCDKVDIVSVFFMFGMMKFGVLQDM